ncbi:MAG: LuxR C-terminal-related transcriptional regulator, partial [Candidatus Limnocylindria bacterium]
ADACHALTEERAHRPARSVDQAVAQIREEARQGRLDHDCVEAVATAIGARGRAPRALPGLTPREVEVLRELSHARSEKEIAKRLGIGERTAHHHVEHIYGKLGVSTRAGAVLQGIARGLLDEPVA